MRSMLRALLVAAALSLSAPAAAEAPQAPSSGSLDHRWGLMQGLMAGITISHGVQPLAVGLGDLEWRNKHVIALGGTALYGTAFAGHCFRQRWSLHIAVIGPMVGLTSVMTAFALDQAGVLELGVRPDAFQLAGGVLQLPAAILAWKMLRESRPRARRLGIAPTVGGVRVVGLL